MNEFIFDIFHFRIISALVMLVLASIFDTWKREIHDVLWVVFAVIAGILLFFEADLGKTLLLTGFSLIILPISFVLWRFGIFGGADAFALSVLAGLAPMATFSENTISPITNLTNAAILSISPMLINVIRNIVLLIQHKNIFDGFEESRSKKISAMFLGYRAKNPRFGFSMESFDGKNKKFVIGMHHADNAEFCTKPDTWITPGIPYMIFIMVGFLIQLWYGDILLTLSGF